MSLFARVFLVVLVLFAVAAATITTFVTKSYIRRSEIGLVSEHALKGSTITSEIQRWQSENKWPIFALSSLKQQDGFEFWWIIDDEDRIYLASDEGFLQTDARPFFDEDNLQRFPSNGDGEVYFSEVYEMIVYRQSFSVGHHQWDFAMAYSIHEHLAAIRRIILISVTAALLTLAVLGLALFLLIRHFLHPLEQLTESVRRIGEGERDIRIEKLTNDEVGFLGNSMNTMVEQLNLREKAQKLAEMDLRASNEELRATTDALQESNRELESALVEAKKSKALEEANKELKEKEMQLKQQWLKLEAVNEELKATVEELYEKNKIIDTQNQELMSTLENLRKAQAKLLQAEKMASLGVLTAGVAHEINNPLNYIIGAYEGLKNYIDTSAGNGEVALCMNAIKTGVERAVGIVRSLNQFSRDTRYNDERCDIHAIVENCLVMMHNKLKDRIRVEKQFFNQDVVVKGNAGNLHQVFLNLLSNAEQAIEGRGTITFRTSIQGSRAIVECIDTGTGIEAEHMKNLTDPFFTTKQPGRGTGLGLSIVYNILQEHEGHIEFESEQGQGTLARVILPL